MKKSLIFLLLLLAPACSSREKLLPDKALFGQWHSLTQKYFIAADKVTVIEIASGDRSEFKYRISNTKETERSVSIHQEGIASDIQQKLIFSNGNQSFNRYVVMDTYMSDPVTFKYVDDKQAP
jgi:hypothetical protein